MFVFNRHSIIDSWYIHDSSPPAIVGPRPSRVEGRLQQKSPRLTEKWSVYIYMHMQQIYIYIYVYIYMVCMYGINGRDLWCIYIHTVYCVHMNYGICIQWGIIYIYRETKNLPYSTSTWNCLNQPLPSNRAICLRPTQV